MPHNVAERPEATEWPAMVEKRESELFSPFSLENQSRAGKANENSYLIDTEKRFASSPDGIRIQKIFETSNIRTIIYARRFSRQMSSRAFAAAAVSTALIALLLLTRRQKRRGPSNAPSLSSSSSSSSSATSHQQSAAKNNDNDEDKKNNDAQQLPVDDVNGTVVFTPCVLVRLQVAFV